MQSNAPRDGAVFRTLLRERRHAAPAFTGVRAEKAEQRRAAQSSASKQSRRARWRIARLWGFGAPPEHGGLKHFGESPQSPWPICPLPVQVIAMPHDCI